MLKSQSRFRRSKPRRKRKEGQSGAVPAGSFPFDPIGGGGDADVRAWQWCSCCFESARSESRSGRACAKGRSASSPSRPPPCSWRGSPRGPWPALPATVQSPRRTPAADTTSSPGSDNLLWGLAVSGGALDPDGLQKAMGRTFQADGIYAPADRLSLPQQVAGEAPLQRRQHLSQHHLVAHRRRQEGLLPVRELRRATTTTRTSSSGSTSSRPSTTPTRTSRSHTSRPWSSPSTAAMRHGRPSTCRRMTTCSTTSGTTASPIRSSGGCWRRPSHRAPRPRWQPPLSDFSVLAVDGYNRTSRAAIGALPTISSAPPRSSPSPSASRWSSARSAAFEDPARPHRQGRLVRGCRRALPAWGVVATLWNDCKENQRPDSSRYFARRLGHRQPERRIDVPRQRDTGHPARTGRPGRPASPPARRWRFTLDSVNGQVLGAAVADGNGVASPIALHLPAELPGGTHNLVAVGRSSGNVAKAHLSVTPSHSPSFSIAAGDTYTYLGRGFVPGRDMSSVQLPGRLAGLADGRRQWFGRHRRWSRLPSRTGAGNSP